MSYIFSFILSGLYLLLAVQALTGQQIASHLVSVLSLGSGVYLPTDGNLTEEITPRWNAYNPPTYVVFVKPILRSDVQKTVRYAWQHNVSFLATGGGHGYSDTLSALQNGIELDMGNFNDVSIDPINNWMTVGGSVRFQNVTGPLYAAGKEMPVGVCSCIGMTGATLGGGIGPYSGIYGTISDSVSSFEMVAGTGELLTVSAKENSELFWGMKGAGFNFGVVTSVTYRLHDSTNDGHAMNADMTFLGSQNASLWSIARSFVGNQPKELSLSFSVGYDTTLEQIVIVANFIYAGPLEKGEQLIKPFSDLQPTNTNITFLDWPDVENAGFYGAALAGCIPGGDYISYSANLYEIDVDSLISIVNFMNVSMSQTPALQQSLVVLTQYAPEGFHLYADNSSAFPFRDAVVYSEVDGFLSDPVDGPVVDAWSREVRDLLQDGSGKPNLEVYVHFAHGDESNEAWYTDRKLPRLRRLKKRYDPYSLFSHYNPIIAV